MMAQLFNTEMMGQLFNTEMMEGKWDISFSAQGISLAEFDSLLLILQQIFWFDMAV